MSSPFIAPEEEQIRKLAGRGDSGPLVMLNLLRFRENALGPAEGMTGAESYGRYSAEVGPILDRFGGRVITALHCEDGVIGPTEPEWDMVIVVEYPSASAFLQMIGSEDYLAAYPYRAAALADSRLVASVALMP